MDHEGATYKTLRDEIAISVIAGWMAGDVRMFWATGPQMADATKQAYLWANVMIEQRDQ